MEAKIEKVRRTFRSGKSKHLDWRERQLTALRNCLLENELVFRAALKQDLGKCDFECVMTELSPLYDELDMALKNFTTWAKPRSVSKPTPKYIWALDSMEIFPEPYGVILIMSPWNYPIQLALTPMIGAIAAGNCVILKPSEISSACEKALTELLPKYLDTDAIEIINTNGKEENEELLKHAFDYIFFTGSPKVGKVVMKAAAEHLTPVTLELGGKSPVVVDEGCDMKLVCQRIAWGKFMNSGQTCIAPDYVLVLPQVKEDFLAQMKVTITEMFGQNPQESPDFGRLISDDHFDQVSKYLTLGTVVHGGTNDKATRFISPTVMVDVSPECDLMQDEIFGPILPVLEITSVEHAVEFIVQRPKPLALYLFSKSDSTHRLFRECTSSGALMTNDTLIHISCGTLPFGGVGQSGMGQYHGEYSFETFSHLKPILYKSTTLEKVNDHFRYAPYSDSQLSHLQTALRYPTK